MKNIFDVFEKMPFHSGCWDFWVMKCISQTAALFK